MSWTDERVEKLKALWATGVPASQIASELGGFGHCPDGGRSSVLGKVHRLKLPLRSATVVSLNKRRAYQRPMKSRRAHFRKEDAQASAARAANVPKRKSSPIRDLLRDLPTEPLPPVDTMPAQVSFNDLEAHHCRAITAEHVPFNADRKIYCGERRAPGKSYCACHVRRYEAAITPTSATRVMMIGKYRPPGRNFGVGEAARVHEFMTETT